MLEDCLCDFVMDIVFDFGNFYVTCSQLFVVFRGSDLHNLCQPQEERRLVSLHAMLLAGCVSLNTVHTNSAISPLKICWCIKPI